ncbi:uncharacterized protein LOC121552653 isoform X4 [Coregonus clupeaformis]|uniref:uncharacterized protein LOC121552653 isoform X4 n=1 Tax=Coregonus clupeaformis TaxID=59861 RepID=UPI001BE0CF40|nr:uncharacterized protein LOC121552653 isoform X4 [Coregonus clupeaformis]
MRQSGFVYKLGMAQSIEGDKHRCKIHQDNDDVVMHEPECSGILELDSLESSEESKEETIVKCSAKPEVVVPANAAIELERRIEEMRRRNEALLERFNDSRSVAKRSERGRRQPKSRRMDDRLEKRCEEEEKNILEERQLIICTIDNGEDAGGYCTDYSGSTSDVERREYLRWKKRRNRSMVELLDQHQDDLAVHRQSSREQVELLNQDDLAVHLQSSREQRRKAR